MNESNIPTMTRIIEEFEIKKGQIEVVWFYKESSEDSDAEITTFAVDEEDIMTVLRMECTKEDYTDWRVYYDNGALLEEFKGIFEFPYVKTLLTNHLNKL